MEGSDILIKLNNPTHLLDIKLIQELMTKGREHTKSNKKYDKEFWNQVIDILWQHLNIGFKKFDDQLLCATCFYAVIRFSNKLDYYIYEILKKVEQQLVRHSGVTDSSKTGLTVSMMYGLLQSPFLTHKEDDEVNNLVILLRSSFDLLVKMGYEYTQYTFIVYKTIRTFKKVCGTPLQQCVFVKENQIRLLNLVNHNWENPVTGVRDQIRAIFQVLISIVNEEMYKKIVDEINIFYWNKAKYLMISEIIQYSNKLPEEITQKELVDGLVYSLQKPGLVSAGADMYYALLKTIQSEQIWCEIFLNSLLHIFKSSTKSIDNFNNYWCLTTLKKFPKLMYIILDAIEHFMINDSIVMFTSLCIMKQGNKLGLLDINDNRRTMISRGLEDNNPKNRMLAFDIICVKQGKMLPVEEDYKFILDFVENNMNTDCTVLRLSMLGSITYLMNHLHVLFLNNIKNEENETIQEVFSFCERFQVLIIKSLSLNGNYQRKITCVKLCNIFVTTLSEVHRKKRDQTRHFKMSLIEYIQKKNYWLLADQNFVKNLLNLLKDPADDVRDCTMKLLLNHCLGIVQDTAILNNLTQNALTCMTSKYFYEIGCGQTIFKLISNLLLNNIVEDVLFQNNEDIFDFAYNELVTEHKLHRNVMETIENGKQMHSFISILVVVMETCIYNSNKLPQLNDCIHKLLNILEDVTNQFSWDEGNLTSSDFSKINNMVQEIITKSGYNPSYDDQTKISGLHQIVLNCLWLNVKGSCDLAALLILYYTDDIVVCKKCLNLVTHVLETSRHKGVIEAAGAALGKIIQHLTSLAEHNEASKLPMALLRTKLNDMKSNGNEMSSITRRGAGLSIMVHRIVSSDMKRDKPLFHYFMRTILKICNEIADVPIVMHEQERNQTDMPKALFIHFLTRIVTDSSLASDMMYYSTELSTLAFSELTNSHWQIRNAALQLYGALVPKLVGQKKPSGTDDETIATVACDELRTHSPNLWEYIMEVLQSRECLDSLITHSNYVPILNILANSAKRYNFSYDTEFLKWEKQLFQNLIVLLGSPIHTVRRLTAKCIYNIYSFDVIYNSLLNMKNITENTLHGALMLVEISHNYYFPKYLQEFEMLQDKFNKIILCGNHCYISKMIFENMFMDFNFDQKKLIMTLLEVSNNKHAPGIFLWAHNRVKKYITNSSWDQIPTILKVILDQSNFEKYLEFLDEKLEVSIGIPEDVVKEMVNIIISSKSNQCSTLVWKIIYRISLKFDMSPHINVTKLMKNLEGEGLYKFRYIIPLIAKVLLNIEERLQIQFATLICALSNPNKADVDVRYIAILANNEIANNFDNLIDLVKIIAVKSAIIFLQDEDDYLRSVSTLFYKNLAKGQITMHAYMCLNKMIQPNFIVTLFNKPKAAIKHLCEDIDDIIKSNMSCTVDEYNPFSNDAKNIYLEPEILKEFILKIKDID